MWPPNVLVETTIWLYAPNENVPNALLDTRVAQLLLLVGLLVDCAHAHCDALVTRTSSVVVSSSEPPACACARQAFTRAV